MKNRKLLLPILEVADCDLKTGRKGLYGKAREMPRALTQTQICADEFDRTLSILLRKAEQCVAAKSHTKAERARWEKVAECLRSARPKIRAMMHPDTRAETV